MSVHCSTNFQYDPSTDTSLKLWLDPSDSTTLLDTGGLAITNGATIGTWSSKAGAARNFTQWGANGRPTWLSNGINGLGAAQFNNQLLTNQVKTDFTSMSSLTMVAVIKRVVDGGTAWGFTELDISTGFSDISLAIIAALATYFAGGRRARGSVAGPGDHFQGLTGNTAPTVSITTITFDYANAKARIYENGVESTIANPFQAAGTTDAGEPFAISVGGFAQQSGNSNGGPCNCILGECMAWPDAVAKTPDDLVQIEDYLCLKWGAGLM